MKHSHKVVLVAVLLLTIPPKGDAASPKFTEPIVNKTVAVGKDVMLQCHVENIGGYKVGWVKADTKAIQAIHLNVITHNSRVSVSNFGSNIWNLHIRRVQEEDGGIYMCQINTNPMKSQIGILKINLSPDFINEKTSGDEIVGEGHNLLLRCTPSGRPLPKIEWRRADGSDIIVRNGSARIKVGSYYGNTLHLTNIMRYEMGAYLCLAMNGVPPSISKRIYVSVTFSPTVSVPNQLVGAPFGTSVTLQCNMEAFPKPVNYWKVKSDRMMLSNDKYVINEIQKSPFESMMLITVNNFTRHDVGNYRCVSKNSLGEVDSVIRLYDITGSTTLSEDDGKEYIGLVGKQMEEQLTNSVAGHGRLPSVEITPRSTYKTYTVKQVPLEGGTPSCKTITITVIITIYPLVIHNFLIW